MNGMRVPSRTQQPVRPRRRGTAIPELLIGSNNEMPCFYHFNWSLGFGELTEISSFRNISLAWIHDISDINTSTAIPSDNDVHLIGDIKADL